MRVFGLRLCRDTDYASRITLPGFPRQNGLARIYHSDELLSIATYQPRYAMRSSSGMDSTVRPTMGSPRLRLTSARMAGSR